MCCHDPPALIVLEIKPLYLGSAYKVHLFVINTLMQPTAGFEHYTSMISKLLITLGAFGYVKYVSGSTWGQSNAPTA
jgi:hypothetical protein